MPSTHGELSQSWCFTARADCLPLPCSFVFKCKGDQDSNAIAFATARTMAGNAQRREKVLSFAPGLEDWELAVKYWNSNNPRMHHFDLAKDNKISGNLKVHCQADPGAKAISKVVRLTSLVKGDELVSVRQPCQLYQHMRWLHQHGAPSNRDARAAAGGEVQPRA